MRKYKIYVSRKEKIFFIVTIALLAVFIIWFMLGKSEMHLSCYFNCRDYGFLNQGSSCTMTTRWNFAAT